MSPHGTRSESESSDLTETHWLVFDSNRQIVGCHCGFQADNEIDCGWGDGTIRHLMELTWLQGFDQCANWWEIHHHGVVRDEWNPYTPRA